MYAAALLEGHLGGGLEVTWAVCLCCFVLLVGFFVGVGDLLVLVLVILPTFSLRTGGREPIVMGVRAALKSLGIVLCSRAPRRHSGFIGLMGRNFCGKVSFRHIVGRFVVRNNSPTSGLGSPRVHLNSNNIKCALPTRVSFPGRCRGHNTLTTTHLSSRIGPRHRSDNYRFCVIRNGRFDSRRLSVVRHHLRNMLRVPRPFRCDRRRHVACGAINNAPRLSNRCAIFKRLIRKFSALRGVTTIGANGKSHPIRSIGVVDMGVMGQWCYC